MNPIPKSSGILLLTLLIALLAGIAGLIWGSRLKRRSDWLGWAGLSALALGAGLSFAERVHESFKPQFWYRGWIWPKEETGAIVVGLLEDPLGLWMVFLTMALSAALLLCRPLILKEPRSDRIFAGIGIGTFGAALAWLSMGPWLALVGLGMTLLGGFVALGARLETGGEAMLAARFAWERSWGVALSVLGAAGLAASRAPSAWMDPSSWGSLSQLDSFSAVLLVAGLAVQFQPFPLLGWAVSPTEALPSVRAILALAFPASCAFSILVRLDTQLRATGVFPTAGWAFLASGVLAFFTGLWQPLWRAGHASWLSSGFSLAAAVLCFSGPGAAVPVFAGFLIGACALSFCATALAAGGVQSQIHKNRAGWSKASGWIAAAVATGMVGSVTCGGALQWIAQAWGTPAHAAAFSTAVFLPALLGWKLIWDLSQVKTPILLSWPAVLAPFIPLAFSLGVVWTGTVTGGAVPGSFDQFFKPLLNELVPGSFPWSVDDMAFVGASWVYWVALLIAAVLGWWLSAKVPALLKSSSEGTARALSFVSGGYGVDSFFSRTREVAVRAADAVENLVDERISRQWVPALLVSGARRLGSGVSRADEVISSFLIAVGRSSVDAPAKALQVLQSGDVQWYLLFAVGSGIALLVHFSRT